ncbi:hypothetical protein ASE74_21635 [Pedobacter sp. Leaf216]|uniref:hypothetical protein n=1 Tax=Pedobacter sp. Leaf216 TaxID=1735684 RepID=UPI0006FA7BD3|nr:hypothetical protein [Pedobacter sp. Leaf216]KQM72904.1 hypothetical protein ASE74_21635 [Pedobacter sp. Leaf216]
MSSFTFEIHNKKNDQISIIDVTSSGGAYSINIDDVFSGTMIEDSEAPTGYFTTDKNLFPFIEHIAEGLNTHKNRISLNELLAAMVGILQLISFLFGTVVTFKLKKLFSKAKLGMLLPAILEFIGLTEGSVSGF